MGNCRIRGKIEKDAEAKNISKSKTGKHSSFQGDDGLPVLSAVSYFSGFFPDILKWILADQA